MNSLNVFSLVFLMIVFVAIKNCKPSVEVEVEKNNTHIIIDSVEVDGTTTDFPPNYFDRKIPYTKSQYIEYLLFWTSEDGMGQINRNQPYCLPIEVLLAKIWFETNGGTTGVAKKDITAMAGIKGKNGVKGYDAKDGKNVQYASFSGRWEGIRALNNLLCVDDKWSTRMYKQRFKDWLKVSSKTLKNKFNLPLVVDNGQQPTWYYWLLSMQADPSNDLRKSKTSYANCGWSDKKIKKYGATKEMRETRLDHSRKMVNWLLKDEVKEILNDYYKKYGKEWNGIGKVTDFNGLTSINISYEF